MDDVVDRAQAEVYDVTERRSSEDYIVIEKLLEGTLDEIERISASGGVGTGIPTGFAELDQITNGLHPGQMVTIAGRPGSGKALALDTPLPTPTGWTTMGAVSAGDYLLGADGLPTEVIAATDVLIGRPCYEVEFSDGTVIVADAQHEWITTTRASRRSESERKAPTWHLPDDVRSRLNSLASSAASMPDRLVTIGDAVDEIGVDAVSGIRRTAWQLGTAGRVQRPAQGDKRRYSWSAPAYSRRALYCALAEREYRPVASWHAAEHGGTVTTAQLATSVHCADGRLNHAVRTTAPVVLPEVDLPVPPYTLGAWLGDGTSAAASLTCADEEILDNIRAEGIVVTSIGGPLRYRLQLPKSKPKTRTCAVCGVAFLPKAPTVRTCGRACGPQLRGSTAPASPTCTDCGRRTTGFTLCVACERDHGTLQARLRALGVLNNKHIPGQYLRASESQRRALLAGVLDTDGYATLTGSVVFAVTSAALAKDVQELACSLGYRVTMRTKRVRGRTESSSTSYEVAFTPRDVVFGLKRKAARQRDGRRRTGTDLRFVTSVREVESVPVRCVQVSNEEHLYLASHAFIPTHNSTLALDIARSSAIKNGQSTAIFSLEMGRLEIMMRLFSAEARVLLKNMRSGMMSDEDWTRMARRSGELASAPLYIDDSPNLTMMEIRAKARRLKQRHDLKLVVIDYLQLMTSGKRVESRQQEVSEFSRAIKLMAKELEVPVIALSQLNRLSEQRTDKKPMLSDLRESGSIEQDSDVVLLVHREDMYERESPRAGEADLILAKHRNGPTGLVTVAFQGHYSRFVDMALPN